MKIEINCSQELLEKSKYCGTEMGSSKITDNCWIALAVQEVFPISQVTEKSAGIFFGKDKYGAFLRLSLPKLATTMINLFDGCVELVSMYEQAATKRLETLTPFSFEIELTEEQENILLENISLPDLTECFAKSKHLTLTV